MSKMSQLHAELDEQGIPDDQKNSALFEKVSAGLKVAEKKIDNKPTTTKSLADDVKDFATKNHCVVTNGGKNYVTTDVWQYILNKVGLTPIFSTSRKNEDDKKPYIECTCLLKNSAGTVISESSMIATKEEDFLKESPDYASWGMAQTRALCRAVKNIYGYIVKEAGFTPTPLCEIDFVKSTKKQEKEGE